MREEQLKKAIVIKDQIAEFESVLEDLLDEKRGFGLCFIDEEDNKFFVKEATANLIQEKLIPVIKKWIEELQHEFKYL